MPTAGGIAAQTALPAVAADGVAKGFSVDRYGDQWVLDSGQPVGRALRGVEYRATTPTWGTGIASSAAARVGFLATECTALFRNSAGAGGKYVVPLWVRMRCTAAGAAGTSLEFGLITDVINRYASGGTQLSGATGANGARTDTSDTPSGVVYGGVITAAAASAPRQMGRSTAKVFAAPCWVVGDEILITFGDVAAPGVGLLPSGTVAQRYIVPFGPIAVAPSGSALLHYWSPAQSGAPSCEYEVAWMEL